MLLMIDNYDSFTYNLVQYFGELGQEVKVYRNDEITIEEARKLKPEYLVISPGPCAPKQAGISLEIIKEFRANLPILGVCLGHQAIGEAFGGNIVKAPKPMHGKLSKIHIDSWKHKNKLKDENSDFVSISDSFYPLFSITCAIYKGLL